MTDIAEDASPAPRRRWRRVADVALLAALLLLLAVAALRGWDTTAYLVVVLQTAGPIVVVGLVLLAAAALLLRRWAVSVPVVAAAVVALVVAAPAWSSSTRPKVDPDLTVMSANLHEGHANPLQIMDAVRYHAVDVLVLVEVTPEAVSDLEDAGARTYFPQRVGRASEGVVGTLLLSRYPLTERDAGVSPAGDSLQPDVDVTTPVGRVRLRAVHPPPPLQGRTDAWHAALTSLTSWVHEQPTTEPLLLAGDFNASSGHPVYRRLADGLVDAQVAAGRGWVRTWPFEGRRIPPYVALDHQLSRGLVVVDAGQVALNRTDHAAVWASYSLSTER
ncbi:endonuclease/exonuclease/phosphatase family protein [Intrasporangium flavum]|uniref:endonuclease/exonuclease/phosphatase family protein n=1 Tax=Intrasporangium flavum TaxID=1428657 RepID=UPI00096FBB1C|nr:endonuclease/exonuclease/phosphatase family protein [Intrasporangium flavum]